MRIKEIKALLLKKGWAGQTISREETVARLNPLLKQHVSLGHLYGQAGDRADDPAMADELHAIQRNTRADMDKLAETVLSCGGTAYSGAGRVSVRPLEADLWPALVQQERALHNALQAETAIDHQIRTEAVIRRCTRSSDNRLGFLNKWARRKGRA